MTQSIKNIINLLQDNNSAIDIKVGYMAGDYDLESSVMECLNYLFASNESQHLKTEAIMHFLHQ